MENVDRELQAAAAQLLTSLRQGRGVEDADADRLRNALRAAAAAWSTSEVIPKKAANLFVDLASGIEACSYGYAPADAQRIKELADEIADLIRACL
jgi:hypothetical protein